VAGACPWCARTTAILSRRCTTTSCASTERSKPCATRSARPIQVTWRCDDRRAETTKQWRPGGIFAVGPGLRGASGHELQWNAELSGTENTATRRRLRSRRDLLLLYRRFRREGGMALSRLRGRESTRLCRACVDIAPHRADGRALRLRLQALEQTPLCVR